MRRWLVDRIRLALRWALMRWGGRVIVFAGMPTQKELDALIAKAAAGWLAGEMTGSGIADPAESRQRLH